jgi:hypothetical protein
MNRFFVDLKIKPVFTDSGVNSHVTGFIIHPEYTRETSIVRHHGTIVNTVGARRRVGYNNRIIIVSPYNITAPFWSVLPRHVGTKHTGKGLFPIGFKHPVLLFRFIISCRLFHLLSQKTAPIREYLVIVAT